VRSSFGPLLLLRDVRRALANVVNLFSPVRSDLRDDLLEPPPDLDRLRDGLEESSYHVKE
jgi:hypothetical protein